ncbi:Golgi to ER traffic- protein [Entomophthora muscae]|uniref:Golgi to ER traffic- protein n=2 Tax=Entomophthora muscae TaxID=34485 RepID=A0ACC2TAI6_9FUNG|nr:Golgi to ER traffic- protein [Entomophthora muscae]
MSDTSDLSDTDNNFEPLDGSLRNVLEQTTLKWIFVGGKGGVGKTTSSCSLAVQLSKVRKSVLLISTDPAHNLSDAFAQKITKEPTLITGFDNLYAMEIDPSSSAKEFLNAGEGNVAADFMSGILESLPGIDEAMSLHELTKLVKSMDYSVVVFDTAPTGHTLRFLQLPTIMDKALSKMTGLQNQFGHLLNTMPVPMPEETREGISDLNSQLKNPELATFVCVCISEFLSLYETERMIQDLAAQNIDTHNIIVNQLLFPSQDSTCEQCQVRYRMQQKYLEQIYDLYEDFHVTTMPLLTNEVRGVPALKEFSQMLITPFVPPNRQ